MAEIAYTKIDIGANAVLISWEGLANGDTGAPAKFAGAADRSVQFDGTWGAGGSVKLEGRNGPSSSYEALTDPQGNAITKTGDALEAVSEVTVEVRPNVTNGDGTTSINCYLLVRGG